MRKEEYLPAIEAILFVSSKPVRVEELCTTFSLDKNTVNELLITLEDTLKERGINISVSKKGFSLHPNEKYRRYFSKFLKRKKVSLSPQALEVIAILIKEHTTKDKIDRLRGVNSTRIINSLLKKGLIRREFREGVVYYSVTDSLYGFLNPESKNLLKQSKLFKESEE